MKCKGTSLGTSCPWLVKQVTGTHVAVAVLTSKPATLHQKLYGFYIELPLVKEQEPEIPKKDAFVKVLCRQIITFLRGEEQAESTDTDYKTFSDMSIDDCNLILEAIAEDDNHQFNRYKISYSPSSKQLVATLPTPIHENLLKPLGLGEVGSTEKSLGTPDALLEFHDEDGGRVQLWGTEVTFSQTCDAAIAKLQCSVTLNPHIIIRCVPKTIKEEEGRLVPQMASEGQFTNITGLGNLQHLFHCTCASLRDTTISYMEEVMAEEESSVLSDNSDAEDESSIKDKSDIAEVSSEETDDSPDPFKLVHAWVPPTLPIDWKAIMKQLRNAAWQMGYMCYSTYHEKLIKCTAKEAEISPRASKRAKCS
ncbi:hypothetical protein BDR06DRAFT_970432 [Suillus hirtellus]|nr:hypothetical protein BDR06DRAFT_970432 [Suillus hirtellus]